ncbi:hypothetical protein HK102_007134, partial [Quaeritorhiza haematococci]
TDPPTITTTTSNNPTSTSNAPTARQSSSTSKALAAAVEKAKLIADSKTFQPRSWKRTPVKFRTLYGAEVVVPMWHVPRVPS